MAVNFQNLINCHRWIVAIIINIILFVLVLSVFTVQYETNDDVGMQMIVSGFRTGSPSEYVVFSNILVGKVLQALYSLNLNFNWYTFYIYFIHFVAAVLILIVLLKRNQDNVYWGLLFFFVYFFFFEIRSLLYLQFTTTAFIIGIAGMSVILTEENKINIFTVIGCLCIWFCGLIRYSVFGLTILAFILLIANELVNKSYKKLLLFSIVIIISFASFVYDRYYYLKDEDWGRYFKYNSIRARLHSNLLFNYNQACRDVGWSLNDYVLFTNWFAEDENVFSIEKIQYIYTNVKMERKEVENFLNLFAKRVTYQILRFTLAFALIVLLIIGTKDLKNKILILVQGCFILTLIVYASILTTPKDRVILSLLLCFIISLFLSLDWIKLVPWLKKLLSKKYLLYPLIVLGILLLSKFMIDEKKHSNKNQNLMNFYMKQFSLLNAKTDTVFVLWNPGISFERIPPFSTRYNKSNATFYSMGCFSQTPFHQKILDKFGEQDIYQALIRNDKFYLILKKKSKLIDYLTTFYRDHYNIEIEATLIDFNPKMNKSFLAYKLKRVS